MGHWSSFFGNPAGTLAATLGPKPSLADVPRPRNCRDDARGKIVTRHLPPLRPHPQPAAVLDLSLRLALYRDHLNVFVRARPALHAQGAMAISPRSASADPFTDQ
jgi:hypothetical protein